LLKKRVEPAKGRTNVQVHHLTFFFGTGTEEGRKKSRSAGNLRAFALPEEGNKERRGKVFEATPGGKEGATIYAF